MSLILIERFDRWLEESEEGSIDIGYGNRSPSFGYNDANDLLADYEMYKEYLTRKGVID